MTNLEKVRTMDVVDLAFILMCPHDEEYAGDTPVNQQCKQNCFDCIKEWLEREAEE